MTTGADDRVLVVDELVAGYIPEVNILNGCNIEVRAGEFVGVIGPNGAGKSTVLKAILGQCAVRSGTVSFNNENITGHKAHELVEHGVGYVPQTQNVLQSLTVKENLEMAEYVKENDMTGLGNYIYLKAYDFAHKLATQQAEYEFNNGELNDE